MYDSRSSHARKPRSAKALSNYRVRQDQINDGAYFLPRPAPPEQVLIGEGLDEYLAMGASETFLGDCEALFADDECDWLDYDDALRAYHDMVENEAEFWAMAEPERMESWEVALLTGMDQDEAEHVAWSSAEWDPRDQVRREEVLADEDEEVDDAWDDKYGRDPFLPCLTIHDVYAEFGDDGWHIEGPNPCRDRTSGKAGGYIRVYELAREVRISTSDMVKALRVRGEYVANGLAYVALPVADTIREEAPTLLAWYGACPEWARRGWAEEVSGLRERLNAPAKITRPLRPGAPRLGRNPFLTNR